MTQWDLFYVLYILLKNKIKLTKLEDLRGFIKGFMNQAASHPATTRALQGLYKIEGCIGRRVGKEATNKRKDYLGAGISSFGR